MSEPGRPTAGGGIAPTHLRVRFHELDPNGHVNHGVYLNYFEVARTELLEDLGFGLGALREQGMHVVVVEANIRFRTPALAGDRITIHTEVRELRRASSWWHQTMHRGEQLLADIDVRAATVTPDGRPTPAPAAFVAAVEALRGATA